MSSRFNLSNEIFSLGLNPSELSVYAYMSSLPSLQDTLDGKATITVKQSTIAQNCGIKAVQTVSKVISLPSITSALRKWRVYNKVCKLVTS